ncbi:MAG: S1 RNA-binding domain-containing protein, partial [Myxococcota bacterium]
AATQTSDLPYPDLGEADTVVGAQAYDFEADTAVGAQPYDPTVPPASPAAPSPAPVSAEPSDAPAPAPDMTQATQTIISEPPTEQTLSDAPAPTDDAQTTPPPPEDLSDADLTLLEPLPEVAAPDVGSIFRGRIGGVAESGHVVIVNREVDKPAVRKAIRAARENHQRVQGVVYGFNRGGFDVLVSGVRAFCPASAMSLTPIEDPNAFVGKRWEFSLPQDKGGKRSIIVSRRSILEKEARKRARERMAELEVGEKLRGKVVEVRDYGVLVDLGGGLDGLVHMSEVSWSRGVRPSEAAKVGDEVDVQVVKVQPATRKDRFGRVSLSMRACQPDPWDLAQETLRVGTPAKGKVIRTTEFGAFVQVAENVEGLLHISELGGNKELTHAKQALEEGAEIDVVIERIDREQRRISLSKLSEADAKAIEAGEIEVGKAPRSLKPGSHIAVMVKRVEHSGAQVQVDGVIGKRGRGFIPNRELQDVRGERRKGPSQGDVIEVKVIGTERDGTLRCSVRARLLDEERKAVRDYRKESAKQGLGTFGDLLKAKLGDPEK